MASGVCATGAFLGVVGTEVTCAGAGSVALHTREYGWIGGSCTAGAGAKLAACDGVGGRCVRIRVYWNLALL